MVQDSTTPYFCDELYIIVRALECWSHSLGPNPLCCLDRKALSYISGQHKSNIRHASGLNSFNLSPSHVNIRVGKRMLWLMPRQGGMPYSLSLRQRSLGSILKFYHTFRDVYRY